jgi:hypothetical protein
MGKSDDDRRKVKGRLWGCSTNLSETNKLMIELKSMDDMKFIDSLQNPEIKAKPIESKPNAFGETFQLGTLFLYKLSDWGKKIKGSLLERFNEHRFNIRYNINIEPPIPIPEPVSMFISQGSSYSQNTPLPLVQQLEIF